MFVDQVVSMFKALVDEPDETFETSADIATLAETAHNELRSQIANSQPKLIIVRQNFNVTNADTYDFADIANATVLLGAGPLAPGGALRIHTIHEVRELDSQNRPTVYYAGVNDETALWRVDAAKSPSYYFENTTMRFSTSMTKTLQLLYVPVLAIDWTKQTAGDNEFIDDFSHYHDLIALKMAEQYMVRDGEINAALRERIAKRELAFDFFCQSGRDKNPGSEVWSGQKNYWE